MGLYDDAVKDVKELKESAMETAKNVLLEAMVPKVKEMVEQQLGESDDIALEMDGSVDEAVEETIETEAVEQEAVELEAKKKDDDEDEEVVDEATQVDEVVEVNESDLVEALADALKEVRTRITSEAKVSKSFGAPADATVKASGGKGEKGIADEKTGEHHWEQVPPPAAKDWTVREAAMKRHIANLTEQVSSYKGAYDKLLGTLKEVNLFNAKLIYTNKVLQTEGLSNKSKLAIIEQFDEARSKGDVELIYNTFEKGFRIAGVMGESAKKLQRGSRPTPPSSTVLKEQMKKETQKESEEGSETLFESWERLSGVSEILKD